MINDLLKNDKCKSNHYVLQRVNAVHAERSYLRTRGCKKPPVYYFNERTRTMDIAVELAANQAAYEEMKARAGELSAQMKAINEELNELNVKGFHTEGVIQYLSAKLDKEKDGTQIIQGV